MTIIIKDNSSWLLLFLLFLLLLGRLSLRLGLLVLLDQLIHLICWKDFNLGLPVLPGERRQLNLLGGELRHVKGLAQHLNAEVKSSLETSLVLLVLLLQHRNCSVPVVPDTGGFPPSVVARGVGLVQLVAKVLVPAHVQDGHAKRPLSAGLGVRLLDVTEPRDQLFAGDGLSVLVLVTLAYQPELIGQEIGVAGDPSHTAHHVLVQLVNLLRMEHPFTGDGLSVLVLV